MSEKYIVQTNKWHKVTSLKKDKCNTSACIINYQFIYIIGGSYNGYLNDIEKYSITQNTMELVKINSELKFPPRQFVISFSVSPSTILITGGYGEGGLL